MLTLDNAFADEENVRGIRFNFHGSYIDVSYHDGTVPEEGSMIRTHFYGKLHHVGEKTVIRGFITFHWSFNLIMSVFWGLSLFGLLTGNMEMGVGIVLIPGAYAGVWYGSREDRKQVLSHISRHCR